MALGEFDLIRNYFDRPELHSPRSEVLGIGDDCALFSVPAGMQLAQSLDTLVSGVHFPDPCDPYLLGYRALAVNVSDLAAMGAEPHSFTLGLTLPESNPDWLQAFSDGLADVSSSFGMGLIGGDTTRGPLTVSIQAQGLVKKGQAMLRSGAKPGDKVYVSGFLGDAAGALPAVLRGEKPEGCSDEATRYLLERYYKPSPRVSLGQWLSENGATSALDISDGLLGDCRHILKASGMGAVIAPEQIPLSPQLLEVAGAEEALRCGLSGGDDYELCFTWPADRPMQFPDGLARECSVTCVGEITEEKGLRDSKTGELLSSSAYRHF